MNNFLTNLASEAERSANLGDHVDIKLMMENFAGLIIKEITEIVYDEVRYEISKETAGNICNTIKHRFGQCND
jgi:hypothetical protein